MKGKKVFIVGGGFPYEQMFANAGFEEAKTLQEADLVQFTGGEDVSPHLYNENRHPRSYSNPRRDDREVELFVKCVEMKIPMAGICRGGQFLNVMNGGKMFQHVDMHTASHIAYDHINGREILVSSTHHQMMRPSHKGSVFLTANLGGFKEMMGDNSIIELPKYSNEVDVEGVYYAETRSVCFQPHPEFAGFKKLADYYIEVLDLFLFSE